MEWMEKTEFEANWKSHTKITSYKQKIDVHCYTDKGIALAFLRVFTYTHHLFWTYTHTDNKRQIIFEFYANAYDQIEYGFVRSCDISTACSLPAYDCKFVISARSCGVSPDQLKISGLCAHHKTHATENFYMWRAVDYHYYDFIVILCGTFGDVWRSVIYSVWKMVLPKRQAIELLRIKWIGFAVVLF